MKGVIYALLAVFFFNFYPVFSKVLLETMSPVSLLFITQALAAVLLLLVMDSTKRLKKAKKVTQNDLAAVFAISFFSSFVGPLLFLKGLFLTSAASAVMIIRAEAIIASLLAVFVLKERVTKHQLVGAGIMMTGILVTSSTFVGGEWQINHGDILVFLSAVAYSVGTVLFKKMIRRVPAEVIVVARNFFGAVMLALVSLIYSSEPIVLGEIGAENIFPLFGFVVLALILAQYFWYRAMIRTSVSKVSLVSMVSPVVGVAYAIAFLGESLELGQIVGGLLILGGLAFLESHIRKTKTPEKIEARLKLKSIHHG